MNLGVYTFKLQTLIQQAKSILILLRKQPSVDVVSASLSLYLSLIQKGKQVTVVCPDKMTVSFADLFAVDKIKDELAGGAGKLVISFPYVEGSIEKVSYNIENNKFNLVIEPRNKADLPAKEAIEFSSAGDLGEFDLIFTIGINDLSFLGKFQENYQTLINNKTIININNGLVNLPSASGFNITNPAAVSLSEIITLLLYKSNLPIDRDIAGNLLKGIKEKTANFQKAGADSFEAASICLRKVPGQPAQFQSNSVEPATEAKKAPPDWLKPKIYRSSTSATIDNNKGTIL